MTLKIIFYSSLIVALAYGGIKVISSREEITVQLPSNYSGWVLLIPSVKAESNTTQHYTPDANGVCLVDTALIRKSVKIKLLMDGRYVESYARYQALTEGHDYTNNFDYKYFQIYLPVKSSWKLSVTDKYWRQQALILEEKTDKVRDSLTKHSIIFTY